jgi:hypothetical protein
VDISPILIVSSSSWWHMPLVRKLLAALVGAGAIVLLVKLMQATLIRRLNDPDSRYYARKLVTLGGWVAVTLLITVVFRDRLGGLTVAIGVAYRLRPPGGDRQHRWLDRDFLRKLLRTR